MCYKDITRFVIIVRRSLVRYIILYNVRIIYKTRYDKM